jgi:hypothetical protein
VVPLIRSNQYGLCLGAAAHVRIGIEAAFTSRGGGRWSSQSLSRRLSRQAMEKCT